MRQRNFGKSDLTVSEISHGTWAMGGMWGTRDDAQSRQALLRGLESGVNLIDTAFGYGQGHAERLIGQVLRETKFKPFVATKCPPLTKAWPPKAGTRAEEAFPAKHLIATTEASLRNLDVEALDLQQLHVWRPEWLEEDDWKETVGTLKQQGKIRHFGVSLNDHDADSGLELVKSGLVDSVQVIFNLFDQSARERLFPLCAEHGVGVLVRVPLDEGGLSGALTPQTSFVKGDWRRHYFSGDRLEETLARAEKFRFLLRGEIRSLAQAALKFCLSEAAVSSVICGMRKLEHVEDNLAVSELEAFTPEELNQIYSLKWERNFYPAYG